MHLRFKLNVWRQISYFAATGGDGDISDRQTSFSHPYLQVFQQIFVFLFCAYLPFVSIFSGFQSTFWCNFFLVVIHLLLNPDNLKIFISFFQVPNAGRMKAAGSLHVTPNSINHVSILTTPVHDHVVKNIQGKMFEKYNHLFVT